MRYRGARICLWAHGSCCLSQPVSLSWRISLVRRYSAQPPPPVTPPPPPVTPQKPISPPPTDPVTPPPTDPLPSEEKGRAEVVKERAVAAIQHAGEVGWQWGQRSAQTANASVSYWWERYEEFVGLNEVRVAQNKVNEAEAAFMVARGMVREAHGSLESLQVRLKEVRDRLDRVSREEAHYLELATQEHKLLQEERRLRTAYENAEGSEREKFGLFSAGVRESHEKERARAERTKNWSIIGSVLGALIGVMGSTYINRVRLQELKTLLLEAQKGPESLQDALRVQAGNHRSQQDELRSLIDSFRLALTDTSTQQQKDKNTLQIKPAIPIPAMPTVPLSALKDLQTGSEKTVSLLEAIPKHMGHLEEGIGRVEDEILSMRKILETKSEVELKASPPVPIATPPLTVVERPEKTDQWEAEVVVRRLEETQRTLGERIKTNNVYNAVFTYTATAITISAVYLLLRGSA